MGILRTLLALSVVVLHSPPYAFHPILGDIAVPLFYVISGYLISYILIEGKSYSGPAAFYVNRILRLFPLYYVVAGLLALAFIWEPYNWSSFSQLPGAIQIYLSITNVTIIGQEWVYLLAVHGNNPAFTTNPNISDFPVWLFLVDSPSWTLGLELTFYLIAPFILPRPILIFGLFLASLLARIIAVKLGASPVLTAGYQFFPFELSMFLAGALTHRYLSPLARRAISKTHSLHLDTIVTLATLLIAGAALFVPGDVAHWTLQQTLQAATGFSIIRMGSAAILCVALPFLFIFQARWKWDAAIGELSYPIYICHRFVIVVLYTWTSKYAPFLTNSTFMFFVMVIGSLLFARVCNRLVVQQVEPLRRWVKEPNLSRTLHIADPTT